MNGADTAIQPRVRKWGTHPVLASKRLPPNFGEIDPNSPFDAQRFFTASAATGNTPHIFYEIGTDNVRIETEVGILKTKLQRKRSANLRAWEKNMDPQRRRQSAYVRALAKSLPFAPAEDGDSKYFYYPLG